MYILEEVAYYFFSIICLEIEENKSWVVSSKCTEDARISYNIVKSLSFKNNIEKLSELKYSNIMVKISCPG